MPQPCRSESRQKLRRQILVLLLTTGSYDLAVGDDALQSVPLTAPINASITHGTTTGAVDQAAEDAAEAKLRFRTPARTVSARTATRPSEPRTPAKEAATGGLAPDGWMTVDNWIARDAVNLQQPLRDPVPATNQPSPAANSTRRAEAPPTLKPAPSVTALPALASPATRQPPASNTGSLQPVQPSEVLRLLSPPQMRSATTTDTERDSVTSDAGPHETHEIVTTPAAEPSAEPELAQVPISNLHHGALADSKPAAEPKATGDIALETALPELTATDTPTARMILNGAASEPVKLKPAEAESLAFGPGPSEPEQSTPQASTTRITTPRIAEARTLPTEAGCGEPESAELPEAQGKDTAPAHGGIDADREIDADESSAAVSPETSPPDGRSGMQLRRLRIDRDGSPTGDTARSMQTSRRSAESMPERAQPAPPQRVHEGDNEPHEYLEATEPEILDEEQTARLTAPPEDDSAAETPKSLGQLDYTGRPAGPMSISSAIRRMQPAMRSCLSYYHSRPDSATDRSNWGMLHQIMVYGADTNIRAGRNTHNAIAWIAGNNACRGQRILAVGPRGIEAKSGIGLQGHQAQLLAVFALCDVPASYPLYAGRQRFSVQQLVDQEAAACKPGAELTFTLIALSHYMDTDDQWTSADGESWNFERLIREELAQPIVGAACGGTHRLMGFSHALRVRRAEGRPITGQWLRAERFIDDFIEYTYQLQNRDGSMSTAWFEQREDNDDLDRKVQTTGHIVEWLLTATPDAELQNPQLVSAIRFLLEALNSDRQHDWQIGPKGHALRALAMYHERVYREGPAWVRPLSTARSTTSSRR